MIVVTVPVHNEAAHIGDLLDALAAQHGCPPFEAVLLLNNCTDATAAVVAGLAPSLPMRVHVHEVVLPPADAHAGMARRLAMQAGLPIAGPGGVLLTTDADGMPDPDWIAGNVAALRAGVEAVAGHAAIDPQDEAKLPPRLVAQEARVQHLTTLLDRIDHLIDPDPADPWPRHTQHSGASIAVTASAYVRVGGIPATPVGEDRAFFDRLRRHDVAIRHAPSVRVVVSGRLLGRADGGMADTMRRRIAQPDQWLDDPVEPVTDRLRRATARAALRGVWSGGDPAALSGLVAVPATDIAPMLAGAHFGAAWAALQAASPLLIRRRVPAGDCEEMIGCAEAAVARLYAVSEVGPSEELQAQPGA